MGASRPLARSRRTVGAVLNYVGTTGGGISAPTGLTAVQSGNQVVTTDASGNAAITFPVVFAGGIATVVVSNGDPGQGAQLILSVITPTTSGFTVRVANTTSTAVASLPVRVNWVAVGSM